MNTIIFAFISVFCLTILIISFHRMRTGGPGPAVNWVPPRLRGRVNAYYRAKGWQEPYDANGRKKKSRLRAF
ncbi:hypothetical protein [Actinomadura nitritigenes]|uniref:hypothetical protein n=1 Tax=Actinomadura nitritigenes TaxID=134602 RepID=UPI003D8D398F